jgi:hypothetical protein
MYNIIIIDTNIYRQLGASFYEHIDYKSLEDYCYSSGAEVIITQTVLNEYLDFYKREIIKRNTLEIERAYDKLKKLDAYKRIRKPNFIIQTKRQLDFIRKKLTQDRPVAKLDFLLNENDLLKFLIENKQENKKDNTRDYLIWLNTLSAAMRYVDYRVILISDDRIFVENPHFIKLKQKYSIKHLEIYKSVPAFLAIYGFKSESLTKESILKMIPVDIIKKELLSDKDSIPSHISNFYYSARKKFKLEIFEIQEVKIDEFYSHRDLENNNVEVIAHVMVKVNMVFSAEKNREALQKHLETAKINDPYKMETFDKEGRPIYNEYILFTFRLTFSDKTNQINHVEFIDFFPDEYKYRNKGSS